jgi:hypothetical protein
LPFETHSVLSYKEGIGVYASGYVSALEKMVKGKDVTWHGHKNKPLMVEFNDTGEKVIIAPRVERLGRDSRPSEYKELEPIVEAHKNREVTADTKAFYTDKYLYVKMPDGKAVRIAQTTSSITNDWEKQKKNSIAAGTEFDGISEMQQWEFAMIALSAKSPSKRGSEIWKLLEKELNLGGTVPRRLHEIETFIKYDLQSEGDKKTILMGGGSFSINSDPATFYKKGKAVDPNKAKPIKGTESVWKDGKWKKVPKKKFSSVRLGGHMYDARKVKRMIDLVGKNTTWSVSEKGVLVAHKDGFQFALAPRSERK